MARVILSEYAAKKLLIGEGYSGYSIDAETDFTELQLPIGNYVVKVDDGTKKRNKKGLVELGLDEKGAKKQAEQYLQDGHRRVLVEPMFKHEAKSEQYISCNLVRAGIRVLYSKSGGNDVEANSGDVVSKIISRADFLNDKIPDLDGVPPRVLRLILLAMKKYDLPFVEINPFVLKGGLPVLLDAAVELDSSKLHMLPKWVAGHIQKKSQRLLEELAVAKLDEQSIASFSLTVFNTEAAIFTLLSGGGASLVVLDALVDNGLQEEVGNYGEYSGAPSREETKIYTDALLSLLFKSDAPRKVLIVAGGVANFTDVTTTFLGIIDSCREHLSDFKKESVLVRVRRGGPRQAEGLALLGAFFTKHNIEMVVSGPDVPLTEVAIDAKKFLENKHD